MPLIDLQRIKMKMGYAGMAGTDGSQLATLRKATAKYHRMSVAEDEGFFAPGPGAMGMHYVHLGRINDGVLDPHAADVLLYEPKANGTHRLAEALAASVHASAVSDERGPPNELERKRLAPRPPASTWPVPHVMIFATKGPVYYTSSSSGGRHARARAAHQHPPGTRGRP